jgi:hypothetical protein
MDLPSLTELIAFDDDELTEHCTLFTDACDLTRRNHRRHIGDLIKACQQNGVDLIDELADALICS